MQQDELHVGGLIKKTLEEEGRSASWLAKKIHCKRDNVYKIFDRPSIDTVLLLRIGLVLKTNFFVYLSEYYRNISSTTGDVIQK